MKKPILIAALLIFSIASLSFTLVVGQPVSVGGGGYTASYRSASTATTSGGGTSVTVTAPSGITDGDLMVALWNFSGADPGTRTPPTGWTAIGTIAPSQDVDRCFYAAYYKIASSESGNYEFTSTNSMAQVVTIVVIQKTGGTFVVPTTANYNAFSDTADATSASITTGSVTTQNNSVLITGFMTDGTATISSGPSGGTQRGTGMDGQSRGYVYTEAIVTGGSGVTRSATWSAADDHGSCAVVAYAE